MPFQSSVHYLRLALPGLLALLAACAGNTPAPVSHDGLVAVDTDRFKAVYAKTDVELEAYSQFAVADCAVAFRANWLRDQNRGQISPRDRVSEKDMDEIRASLGDLCREQFMEALTAEPSYRLVEPDDRDAATLVLVPRIIDLDVVAPDVQSATRSYTFTTESGSMTLVLEVLDGSSGEVLYRVVDRRKGSSSVRLEWSNRITNMANARRVLKAWGRQLREGLDQAMAHSGA